MLYNLHEEIWWNYLEHDLKELLRQANLLLETAETWEKGLPKDLDRFHDYSFIIFPAAKAYEGFLKRLFFDMGFISKTQYEGKRIRIGKVLNPNLYEHEMRKQKRYKTLRKKMSIYDKMVHFCGSEELPLTMWNTWKDCRNALFHWYPNEKNAISLDEARKKFAIILDTMNLAFKGCNIEQSDAK